MFQPSSLFHHHSKSISDEMKKEGQKGCGRLCFGLSITSAQGSSSPEPEEDLTHFLGLERTQPITCQNMSSPTLYLTHFDLLSKYYIPFLMRVQHPRRTKRSVRYHLLL